MKKMIYFFAFVFSCIVSAQNVSDIVNKIHQGQIQEARALLQQIQDQREPDEVLFMQALLSTDGATAESYYKKLLDEYPDYVHCDFAVFRLAELFYARALYIQAREMFLRLINEYPNSQYRQSSEYWIAQCDMAMNNTESAADYFRSVVENFPQTDFTIHAMRALESLNPSLRASGETVIQDSPVQPHVKFGVQIYAFTDEIRALNRKAFFERDGYTVHVRTRERGNQLWYLVWMGAYSNREDADMLGKELKRKYGIDYFIVSYSD